MSFNNSNTNNNNANGEESLKTTTTNNKLSRDEKSTAAIWDRFADGYNKSPIKDMESYQTKLEVSRRYFSKESTKMLEFGCGTGGTAILHAPYVNTIHAIDISPKMIDIAQSKLKEHPEIDNVTFEAIGFDRYYAKPQSYDIVCALSILHLMPKKEQAAALTKVHDILKPNGRFISSTTCMGDFAPFLRYIFPVGTSLGLLPKISVFTSIEFKERIVAAGFEIEHIFHPGKDKAVFLVCKKKKGGS